MSYLVQYYKSPSQGALEEKIYFLPAVLFDPPLSSPDNKLWLSFDLIAFPLRPPVCSWCCCCFGWNPNNNNDDKKEVCSLVGERVCCCCCCYIFPIYLHYFTAWSLTRVGCHCCLKNGDWLKSLVCVHLSPQVSKVTRYLWTRILHFCAQAIFILGLGPWLNNVIGFSSPRGSSWPRCSIGMRNGQSLFSGPSKIFFVFHG